MWRYIVRRLLWVVVVLLIITAITFVIFFVMPPTDPATTFGGRSPTPELIAEIEHQFGLDKPVWQQYLLWLKNLVFGDEYGWPGLGFSYATRTPIRELLLDRLPITITLAVGAALIWTLERGLGAGFTSEMEQAWCAAYDVLAGVMKQGMKDAIPARAL